MRTSWMLATIVACAGCGALTGGKSGSGTGPVDSGSWAVSNGQTQSPDQCAFGDASALDGRTFGVTASGTEIDSTFGIFNSPATATASAGNFAAQPVVKTYDWTDTAQSGLPMSYDCKEQDTYTLTGAISDQKHMHVSMKVQYQKTSGTDAQCLAANQANAQAQSVPAITTFPCETLAGWDATHQ